MLIAGMATFATAVPVAGTAGQPTGLSLTKTASPANRPEPGGTFTFTVDVTNRTGLPATINSLTDDVYGNLASRGTCGSAIGFQMSGEVTSFSCTFSAAFTGSARAQLSTTTAAMTLTVPAGPGGGGSSSLAVSASGQTTITLTDVKPTVTLTHSVAPASRPAPGGDFTYSEVVTNTSEEDVTIASLVDDIHGNLAVRGSCDSSVGTTLAPGGSYACSFVAPFNDAAGTSLIDQVTVSVTDDDGSSASATATATVTLTQPITTTLPTTSPITTTTRVEPTTVPSSSTTVSDTTTVPDTVAPPTTAPASETTTTIPVGLEVLSGPSSEPGGDVRVRGGGCTAGGRVAFLIDTTTIGEAQAGQDGSFEATVAVPSVEPGRLELVADCGTRFVATLDLVVASRVDALSSTLAVFIFFVLLSLVLFRRRRVVLPRRRSTEDELL